MDMIYKSRPCGTFFFYGVDKEFDKLFNVIEIRRACLKYFKNLKETVNE